MRAAAVGGVKLPPGARNVLLGRATPPKPKQIAGAGAESITLFAMMRVVRCLCLLQENHYILTLSWISVGRDVNMF